MIYVDHWNNLFLINVDKRALYGVGTRIKKYTVIAAIQESSVDDEIICCVDIFAFPVEYIWNIV